MRIELKCFRIKNNLTQKEMAKKLNICRAQYIRIEKGLASPTYRVLEKFAEVFEVDNVFELFKSV